MKHCLLSRIHGIGDGCILFRYCLFSLICAFPIFSNAGSLTESSVLVEAEHFKEYGGWVDDSQFMDQMGSSFLLAHGLGKPVADAVTSIRFPRAGKYRVWARTRDWVATWKAPGTPGRFQVLIDGKPLSTDFGIEGAEWHWQAGGIYSVTPEQARKDVTIALHDLTGFDGRCDALLFVPAELSFTPPHSGKALKQMRYQLNPRTGVIQDAGNYDLVVVGGGIAGICASVSAARSGLSVALIQDRPMLGGNNSSEVRVWLQGVRNRVPYPHIGDIVMEIEPMYYAHFGPANKAEIYEDDKKNNIVRAEKNISLHLLHRANGVEMVGNKISAVIAEHTRTGERFRFRGKLFLDSTGDGCLGALAGADSEMSVPHMGRCNLWNVINTNRPQPFPRCPWALDLSKKRFPGRGAKHADVGQLGGWYWESGFDHDPIEKSEYIRDWNLRAAFGAFDALKNVDKFLPNYKLNWMSYISGKRESRRLLGDIVLTDDQIRKGKPFKDACVPTCWSFDDHKPLPPYDKGFKGDAFISQSSFGNGYQGTRWIPYRCLYSRNIDNLFMAGRDISVTHKALGACRVMRTGGCMGEVVGLAASVCIEKNTNPRGVWKNYLDLLISKIKDPIYTRYTEEPLPEEWKGKVGKNLAPEAEVKASSQKLPSYSPTFVNDRRGFVGGNGMRWVSAAEKTPWLEFTFKKPVTISALRLTSGSTLGNEHPEDKDYWIHGMRTAAINDYRLEVKKNGRWETVKGAEVSGNKSPVSQKLFIPTEGRYFRLSITKTPGNHARVWEVELFEIN